MELALARPTMALSKSSDAFGPRLQPPERLFRTIYTHACQLESNPPRTAARAAALDVSLDLLDEQLEALSPDDLLFRHVSLLGAAAAALCWVSADAPPPDVVAAAANDARPHLEALRAMAHPSNTQFADAADAFLAALAKYVTENAPKPLPYADRPAAAEAGAASASAGRRADTAIVADRGDSAGGVGPAPAGRDPPSSSASVHSAPHLQHFRDDILSAPLVSLAAAADAIGGSLPAPTCAFVAAHHAAYDFIVAASLRSAPPDDEAKQAMLQPIIKEMTNVTKAAGGLAGGDPLANHVKALEDAVSMMSWLVADSRPMSFVSDAEAAASFYLDKVLVSTKKSGDAATHKAFVESLRSVFAATKKYIKEHQTMGLRHNVPLDVPEGMETASSPVTFYEEAGPEDDAAGSYVTAFEALTAGPLTAFVAASEAIGAEVAEQAAAFKGAWLAEAEFLKKAIRMPKPDDIQDMLAPIAAKMGDVSAIAEKVDPRGPLAQHCTALSESVAALGWVAVEEKATAFVGDMAGAGQFFVDKVKMGAKKTDNPDAHRAWATALENLYAELKAYVKLHHTQKLEWNPPKTQRAGKKAITRSTENDESSGTDYVSAFKKLLSGPLAAFRQASDAIGGEVAEQAAAFEAAWEAKAAFLAKSINMPKPDDIQDMLGPIASKMGEVGAIAEKLDPRGPLAQHCTAVAESVAALGWVAVEEKATAFVGDMAGAGQFFVDKVKMGAKKTDNPDAHRTWAKSLETLFADLKAYVKEHHTQKLVWNPPKTVATRGQVPSSGEDEDDEGGDSDYVSAFKVLIDGPLAAFITAAKAIGGEVEEQTALFAGAWEAEAEFLSAAMSMPKPDDIQDMLAPIAEKMGEVGAVTEKVDPRGPLAQHCNALSESVAALGWVAVDEKATAFVGDMAGAGQFFIDKVKMGAKETGNPDAHRSWAKALETLLADLRAYVKEYHTQRLVWNPSKIAPKRGTSARAISGAKDEKSSGDYVTAFKALIDGPLAEFMSASKSLGGELAHQATAFFAAWEAEEKFLKKAISMPEPDDVQEMLAPIASRMKEVGAVLSRVDPRDPLAQHCNALGESVAALGWIAVEEKATAFVGEMAGAGQFFMDKVKIGARSATDPAAHRAWVKSLETLFADLKAYVKEYHTQKLTWNSLPS